MATDFVGTNSEKTDKIIVALVELRTTVRLLLAAVGLGTPLVVGFSAFLVVQSYRAEANLERLSERTGALTGQVNALTARVDGLSSQVNTLTVRVELLTTRVEGLTERVSQLERRKP